MTMTETAGRWTPGEGVRDHQGGPLAADRDFFAPPPDGLGTVLSAHSTLRAGQPVTPVWVKLGITAVTAGLAVGVTAVLVRLGKGPGLNWGSWGGLFWTVFAVVAVGVALTITWRHRCSYVGTDGIASLRTNALSLTGGRRVGVADVLRFADAVAVTAGQVRHYTNGVYTGTRYTFAWWAPTGRRAFNASGSYRAGRGKRPKLSSPFNFAAAAETAWSHHFLPRAVTELEQTGWITFGAGKNRFVRLAPGTIEFHLKGEPVTMPKDQIRDVRFANGVLTFAHADATWYGRGKYTLPYGQLANGKVFLLALDKLMGYQFG